MKTMSQNIKSLALVGSLLSCVLVGQVCAAELKVVDKIKVPGAGVESFDISYMDQKTNRFYLADRTNAALDIIDASTGKFIAQIPGFVGPSKSGATAGPNGVVVAGNEAWVGDGDSTVKVVDLKTNKIVDTISTGGKKRADEVAYDPKNEVFIIANDKDEPPFLTLISTKPGHKIIKKIDVPDASDGIEQTIYYAPKGTFLTAIPELKGEEGIGGIAVINPLTGEISNVMKIADCAPAGLAQGPGHNVLVGCSTGGAKTKLKPVTIVLNADTGKEVARIAGIGASDEVAYSAKNGQYYITGRDMPNGPIFGVIDAKTNTLIQSISTGGNTHSVAVNEANGHVLVPTPKSAGTCDTGCITVYDPK
jgi:DNA-binding beta-propeller fold protein YncE